MTEHKFEIWKFIFGGSLNLNLKWVSTPLGFSLQDMIFDGSSISKFEILNWAGITQIPHLHCPRLRQAQTHSHPPPLTSCDTSLLRLWAGSFLTRIWIRRSWTSPLDGIFEIKWEGQNGSRLNSPHSLGATRCTVFGINGLMVAISHRTRFKRRFYVGSSAQTHHPRPNIILGEGKFSEASPSCQPCDWSFNIQKQCACRRCCVKAVLAFALRNTLLSVINSHYTPHQIIR